MKNEMELLRRQVEDLKAEVLSLQERLKVSQHKNVIPHDKDTLLDSETVLRQSEEKFRLAFQTSPDSINFNRLSDGMYIDVNEGFTNLTGYTREDAIGKTSIDLNIWYDPKDRERLVKGLTSDGYVKNLEARFKRKNGQIGIGLMSASILAMNKEEVILSITRDITERKRKEQELRESGEKYRQLIDATGTGYVIIDDQGRVTDANQEYVRLTGRRHLEDVLGNTVLDWTAPHDLKRNAAEVRKCVEQGFVRNLEIDYVTPTGQVSPVGINAAALRTSGTLLLHCLCRDITERKQAEKALRASEERLRLALEAANQGLYDLNVQTGESQVSPEYAVMLGYDPAEFHETNAAWIERLHPEDRGPVAAVYRDYIAGKIPEYQVEFRQRTKSGDWKWILSHGKIVERNARGEPLRMLGTHTDITERKQAEENSLREHQFRHAIVERAAEGLCLCHGVAEYPYVRFTVWNPRMTEITGYTMEEINRLGWYQTLYPDPEVQARAQARMDRMRQGEDLLGEEWEIACASGEKRVVSISTSVIETTVDSPQILALMHDVTVRKRAEEELRLDDQRMEALLHLNQMTHASLQEIASFALEEAVRLTKSRIGYLAFANEDESVLTMYAWSRSAMAECAIERKPIVYPVADTGLWGETVRQRKAVITNDYQAPSPLKRGFPKGHVHLERHLGIPVFDGHRIVIVAGVGNKGSDYNERDIKQLDLLMSGIWRIVQRKQAEEALRESEARFRTAFENASVGITLVGLDGIYLVVNEAMARMIGYSPADLIGKPVADFTHPADLGRRSDFLSDLISGRIASGEQERRFFHRNGSVVWTLISASVQRDQSGKPLHFISLVQDITERKQAEEKFRETEKKYSELADSLPQVIFEVDLNGTLTYVNNNAYDLFGYSPEEIAKGFNVLEAFIPEDRERVALDIMLNIQGQKLGRKEYTAVRKDGTKFPVSVHANRFLSGQTAIGVIGILIDLTLNFSLTVDRRFCSISSHKCPYSLGAVFFERETVVPQI